MEPVVRSAETRDIPAINEIANWYIEHTTVNFDTEPWGLDRRYAWAAGFNRRGVPYHLLVCEHQGRLTGFCCNTRFRPKKAYDSSTETTVYTARDAGMRGYGTLLYGTLLEMLRDEPLHRAYAIITLPNPASIRLHERFGYTAAGLFDEAGWKFNRYHNVAIYQKVLT